jgi:hypothetical protein
MCQQGFLQNQENQGFDLFDLQEVWFMSMVIDTYSPSRNRRLAFILPFANVG